MSVEVIIKTTTYEGKAMNSPVPSDEDEILSDMYPDTSGFWPWILKDHWSEGTSSCYKITKWLKPNDRYSIASLLKIRVMDYAAAADITVSDEADSGNVIQAAWSVPFKYTDYLSNGDSDEDGFTAWEEYRGLIDPAIGHVRLDTNRSEVFLARNPNSDEYTLDRLGTAEEVAVDAGAPFEEFWIADDIQTENGRFLDFMCHLQTEQGATFNPLCDPGYTLPGDPFHEPYNGEFHQGTINLQDSNDPTYAEHYLGLCFHCLEGYPAGTGTEFIDILFSYIDAQIATWELTRGLDYPGAAELVRNLFIQRAINHELGHAWGLTHNGNPPEMGDFWCAMSYILFELAEAQNSQVPQSNRIPRSYNPDGNLICWSTWLSNVGSRYTYDGCDGTLRLRP